MTVLYVPYLRDTSVLRRLECSGFGDQGQGSVFRVGFQGSQSVLRRVQDSDFRQGAGFRVQVQGSGFRVQGSGPRGPQVWGSAFGV